MPIAGVRQPEILSVARLPAVDVPAEKFLTIQEVCGRLNLSRTSVWRIMNQHGLRFIRVGGLRRIRERDLEIWLEQHTVSLSKEAT